MFEEGDKIIIFAHFATMEADFLDDCPDDWPYLLSIREHIGVFEAPRSFYKASRGLNTAKELRNFWKNEVGNGVSIFKIPVWPERRRR